MKKNLIFLMSLIFLSGCSVTSMSRSSSDGATFSRTPGKTNIAYSGPINEQACSSGNVRGCMSYGDALYSKGDFKNAIRIYNIACEQQDVSSCVKMAKMFEAGQGVPANKVYALDIYTRACYSGDAESCKDKERLSR